MKEQIYLNNYVEFQLTLPCVVDELDFASHAALDVVHLDGEQYHKDQLLTYRDRTYQVVKKLRDLPIKTETLTIENRTMIRKCRYYCLKVTS